MHIAWVENDNNTSFTPETKLEIFQRVFIDESSHESSFLDYRLKH